MSWGSSLHKSNAVPTPLNQPPLHICWFQPSGRAIQGWSMCHNSSPDVETKRRTNLDSGNDALPQRVAASAQGNCSHTTQSSEAQSMGFSASPPTAGVVKYRYVTAMATATDNPGSTHMRMAASSRQISGNPHPIAAGFQRSFQRFAKRVVFWTAQFWIVLQHLLGQVPCA